MGIPRGFIRFRTDAVGGAVRDKIKQNLTIFPESTSSFTTDPQMIRLWAVEGDWMGVPRGVFLERIRGRYVDDFEFQFSEGNGRLFPADPITPRDGQEDLIAGAVAELSKHPFGGVILEAKTAAGKTAMGLETARRLGLKTLVIVHTTVLAEQWCEEIKKFFPTWRVGRLQADKIDIQDKDIVIGMLQSASMKDYPPQIYEEFGTIMVDEVHKAGAPEFGKVLHRFAPKHFIGLTGTIKRADKAENVFIYGIGKVISGMEEINVLDPRIYLIDTSVAWWSPIGDDAKLDRQKPHFLKAIVRSPERNEIIIKQAMRAAEARRNILILSERVGHAEDLAAQLKRRGVQSVGLMVGISTKKEREMAQEAQVICATQQLVGTGFNLPRLDTLIFATPVQAVEQPVGRILRTLEGKKEPMVLDLIDSNCRLAMVLARSRLKRYSAKGWQVNGANIFERVRG